MPHTCQTKQEMRLSHRRRTKVRANFQQVYCSLYAVALNAPDQTLKLNKLSALPVLLDFVS